VSGKTVLVTGAPRSALVRLTAGKLSRPQGATVLLVGPPRRTSSTRFAASITARPRWAARVPYPTRSDR